MTIGWLIRSNIIRGLQSLANHCKPLQKASNIRDDGFFVF